MSILKAFTVILKIVDGTDYILSTTERQEVLDRYQRLVGTKKFIGPKPVTLEMRHLADPAPGSDSIKVNYTVTDKADGERALLFVDAEGHAYLIDDRMNVRFTGLSLTTSATDQRDTILDCEVVKARQGQKILACFDAYFVGSKDVRGLPLLTGLSLDAEDRLSHLNRVVAGGFSKQREGDPDVIAKEFRLVQHGGDDVFNQVRYLVRKRDAGNIPYDTDGFIFTPSLLPVGASDDNQQKAPAAGGTWDKVFKWKPPAFNSIDFLLRFSESSDVVVIDDAIYRSAQLYVGTKASTKPVLLMDYVRFLHQAFHGIGSVQNPFEINQNPPKNPPGHQRQQNNPGRGRGGRRVLQDQQGGSATTLDSSAGITGGSGITGGRPPHQQQHQQHQQQQEYVARLFEAGNTNTLHLCYLRVAEDGTCRCENGDVINDGTIVEMTYGCPVMFNQNQSQDQKNGPECWRPLRVRADKTERYRQSGSISGAANDIKTALSVWRSICFPVSLDVLTGHERLTPEDLRLATDVAANGLYYVRNKPREQSASLPMIVFHNHWVKRASLLMKFKGTALSNIDFGCGRGGDIKKWVAVEFLRVLGIDPVDDNLTNPGPVNEGACMRAMNEFRRSSASAVPEKRFPKIVFLRMDASIKIDRPAIQALEAADPETSAIARSLWAIDGMAGMPPELRSLHGFAAQGFDLATCMFAIHYFFENSEKLTNFIANVANQLRSGGHFLGACLDGKRVRQLLERTPYGSSVEGRKDGRLIWSITRLYEDSGPSLAPGGSTSTTSTKSRSLKSSKSAAATAKAAKAAAPTPEIPAAGTGSLVNNKKPEDPRLGQRIRVFVETIGQPIDEFLVDFDLLTSLLAPHGIRPMTATEAKRLNFQASSGSFEDLYGNLTSAPKEVLEENPGLQVALQMSEAEKEYSFMHRWFVFTKK